MSAMHDALRNMWRSDGPSARNFKSRPGRSSISWISLSGRERSSLLRNLPSVGRWSPNVSNALHGHAGSAW